MLMIHNNGPVQMQTTKVKGPPPVPPRPNQSVVAEALAKTRKAVAESRANNVTKSNIPKEIPKRSIKAKTLERASSIERPSASPKQNGLARVKSFIRDVISSDRSSSSDERKSSGPNSRRSSSDSSSIPAPISIKKSNESLNFKSVKNCKQILVRSLSTSNKLDADPSKGKVSKSSSFAAKTIPIRKAPPPPLSPKPKLRPLRPLSIRQQSLSDKGSPKHSPDLTLLKHSPELTPYVLPIDVQKPPTPINDAPYASVEEFTDIKDRLPTKPDIENNNHEQDKHEIECEPTYDTDNENNNSLERKTSRVTEMLISEIIASRQHKEDSNAVIDKGKVEDDTSSFEYNLEPINKDMSNHEMLIYELQTMRSQSNVPESLDTKELVVDKCESECSEPNYAMSSECSGSTDDGSDQAYAYILDDDLKSRLRKQFRAISTMSLHGLPPLPKSLSGFADAADSEPSDSSSSESNDKPPADLEGQLAYLKREMANLRQLDLSLLSELWSLSEAMASWRRQLERQPRLRPAPPPPPPPHHHYLRT